MIWFSTCLHHDFMCLSLVLGKKLNQSSFSDLLKNSNPPVKLEELWQKLNIKESSKFRSSFIRKLKIWDECSNPWKAWKELAASIESMPATPKELRYSLGTKVRLAAGIGKLMISTHDIPKCEHIDNVIRKFRNFRLG